MKDTIKIEHGTCKIIAHRGASALERENTLAAFVAAGNRTYYGIETDIHPTLDGELVIIHDYNTSRVSKSAINVEECRYSDLRSLKLNDLDGRERSDLSLPLLSDYLRIAQRYDKHCFIELKGRFSEENIKHTIETVKEEYSLNRVTFISFEFENLTLLRELLPMQSIQYLTTELTDDLIDMLARLSIGIDALHTALTPELVERMHLAGLMVNCWTVDDPMDAERLIEMGVDLITSNTLE